MRVAIGRVFGLFGARSIASALQAAALLVVARETTVATFGYFSVILGTLSALSAVANLGLPAFGLRAAAKGNRALVAATSRLNITTSSTFLLVSLFFTPLAARHNLGIPLIGLALALALEKNSELRIALAVELGRSRSINAAIVARGTITLALTVSSAAIAVRPELIYTLGRLLGAAALAAAAHRVVPLERLGSGSAGQKPFKDLPAFALTSGVGALRQLDVVIVAAIAGSAAAGVYAVVAKLAVPIAMLASSIGIVAMGHSVRASREQLAKLADRILILCLVATGPLVAASLPFRKPLAAFFGAGYETIGATLAFYLLAATATFAVSIMATMLQAHGHQNIVAWITAGTVVTGLILLAAGARMYGELGAMFGFAVGFWLNAAALWLAVRKTRGK